MGKRQEKKRQREKTPLAHQPKKRIYKSNASKDPSYHPKKSRKQNQSGRGLFGLRGVDTKEKVSINGELQPKETAVLYNRELFAAQSPTTFNLVTKGLQKATAKSKTHRPIAEIIETSEKGTPRKVRTPNGNVLTMRKNYEAFRVFSNHPLLPDQAIMHSIPEEKKSVLTESPFQRMKLNQGKHEFKEIHITPELLRQAKEEIKACNGVRKPSQGIVMSKDSKSVSADRAGKLLMNHLQYEFLHFICFHALGNKAQHDENMGIGSKDSNSDMLFVEIRHDELAEIYPEGFMLQVTPHFIDNTQMLTYIDYVIKGPDFSWKFVFNCQTKIPPDIAADAYMGALIVTQRKLKMGELTPSTPPIKSLVFFPDDDQVAKKLDFTSALTGHSPAPSADYPKFQ